MKHRVTEEVTVKYEVDIPDEAIDAFSDEATAAAVDNTERETIYNQLVEEYVCENQPDRDEWMETVHERDIDEMGEGEEL